MHAKAMSAILVCPASTVVRGVYNTSLVYYTKHTQLKKRWSSHLAQLDQAVASNLEPTCCAQCDQSLSCAMRHARVFQAAACGQLSCHERCAAQVLALLLPANVYHQQRCSLQRLSIDKCVGCVQTVNSEHNSMNLGWVTQSG